MILPIFALSASLIPQTGCRTSAPATPAAIELQYDEKLSAIGFPSPLLRAAIHGHTAWFIIDTGASVHTLATWFATEAKLVPRATEATTTGSTGAKTPVKAVYGESMHIDGRAVDLQLREAILVDFPPIFRDQRIGGLLSPQLLAPAGMAAILDLHAPRLSFGSPPVDSPGTRVCRNQDSPFTNRLYAAQVTVGSLQSSMLIDTGATGSVALPLSRLAHALSDRASEAGKTQGVGGQATVTRKVPGVTLQFGGGEATVSLTIGGAASACAPDGLLGMDALRQCRLVLGESTFAWYCQP
jgi:hypothetical protein